MPPPANTRRYKNHRLPGDIIHHGVWIYYRFIMIYHDVQELLFERSIYVTYEARRQWCLRFGQDYANQLRRRRPRPGDKWHLDEVFLTMNGTRHYLWRAVDQDDDERADAAEEDAELVDAERCRRGRQALRVVQRSVLLKGSPRYVALSYGIRSALRTVL